MMDMAHHQFCLKWNNHSSNLLKVFGRLFSNESFTDVTLAAEGRSIRAHKMVLSACSTYFEQLFLEHAEPNPIVIMRETSFIDLAIIVEFMYKGEINVSQDQLGSLLRTAESLRVKGLAQASSGNGSSDANESQNNHSSSHNQSSAMQQHKTSTTASSPTTPPLAGTSNPPPFSPPPYPSGQHQAPPPPPALLPLFQNAALLSAAAAMDSLAAGCVGGRESPSSKRRRIKPKIEQDYPQLNHSVDSGSSRPSSASFTPRIENVVTMLKCGQAAAAAAAATQQQRNESVEAVAAAAAAAAAAVAGVAGSALDLRLTDPAHVTWDLHELKSRLEPRGTAFPSLSGGANNTNTTQTAAATGSATTASTTAAGATQQQPQTQLGDSETLRKVQQEKSEPHCFFRGFAVYKFNDYIAHGTRQQYWEEPFTKAVMEGIQDRELDLKKGAELLGVSYSTLYGRYRECHGYLRHAWTRDYRRSSGPGSGSAGAGGEWWENDPHEIHRRGENGGMTAEELVVEVDSYVDDDDDIMAVERDDGDKSLSDAEAEAANKQESLILSIRHGKVQTGRKPDAPNSKESSS